MGSAEHTPPATYATSARRARGSPRDTAETGTIVRGPHELRSRRAPRNSPRDPARSKLHLAGTARLTRCRRGNEPRPSRETGATASSPAGHYEYRTASHFAQAQSAMPAAIVQRRRCVARPMDGYRGAGATCSSSSRRLQPASHLSSVGGFRSLVGAAPPTPGNPYRGQQSWQRRRL
jgi:hypothetical protein